MKNMKKKEIRKTLTVVSLSLMSGFVLFANSITVDAMDQNNRQQVERWEALVEAGYDWQVAADQVDEEINHVDGAYGTGGIDGLLLNGKPAGSSNSSGSSSAGTSSGASNSSSNGTSTTAHQHKWVETITLAPTCTTEGEKTLTCECGETRTEKIDITAHDYEKVSETPGDCQNRPTITYQCVCGDTYTEEYGAYGDHIYIPENDSVMPTCVESGRIHYKCNVCQEEYYEDVEPLGHSFSEEYTVLKSATCTEDGYKAIICSNEGCDEEKEGSGVAIPTKGHTPNPEHVIQEATFWNSGLEEVYCIDCGEKIETIVIPDKGGIFKVVIPVGAAVLILASVSVVLFILKKRKKK